MQTQVGLNFSVPKFTAGTRTFVIQTDASTVRH